jgi:SAM-dependent methyltransferase
MRYKKQTWNDKRFKFINWKQFKGKSVLDLGCEKGLLALKSKLEGAKEVVGIEICPRRVELAKAEYKIKNVIEYGVGLSTELMMMEGIEVLSLETLDWWADICRKAIGNEIITYQEGNIPEIDRKFDFAFVDGPQTKRTNEILHAKQHSDIIYLHDLRPEEVKLLDDWEVIENYGKHYYKK